MSTRKIGWGDFAKDAHRLSRETSDPSRRVELRKAARSFEILCFLKAPMPKRLKSTAKTK